MGRLDPFVIEQALSDAEAGVRRNAVTLAESRLKDHPKLAQKQGAYSVIAASGLIMKRGHELERVLRVFDKSLKLVES